MNQTQAAKELGISQPRLSKLIKDGVVKKAIKKIGHSFDIDITMARQEMRQGLDPGRKIKAKIGSKKKSGNKKVEKSVDKKEIVYRAKADGLDMYQARALNEQYKAALKKLEFDQKKGILVDINDIRRIAFEAGKQFKEHALAIPDRCAPLVAACQDDFKCKEILTREIVIMLENLSEALARIN